MLIYTMNYKAFEEFSARVIFFSISFQKFLFLFCLFVSCIFDFCIIDKLKVFN